MWIVPAVAPFARFAPPDSEPVALLRVPPKTTFGGPRSPEGLRIIAFMDEIAPLLAAGREAREGPLGLALAIGLPLTTDLLIHHDLDNFLEPLAIALASPALCFASATKQHGPVTTLSIGPVAPARAGAGGWERALPGARVSQRRAGARSGARSLLRPSPCRGVQLSSTWPCGSAPNATGSAPGSR
jgi:hypothetical protein